MFVTLNYVAVVRAADPLMELTVSPTDEHYSVRPGQTISDTATVLNSGQQAYQITVYSTPYSVSGTDYTQNFTQQNMSRSADAYKWVVIPRPDVSLAHRQTAQVPFTLTVPKNASPGGHYASLFFEVQPNKDDTGVIRKHRIGIIIYVDVQGNTIKKGSVEKSTVPFYQPNAPLSASVLLKNEGNVDFQSTNTMIVKDIFGHILYQNDWNHYILPSTTRKIPLQWTSSPWIGLYHVQIKTSLLQTTKSASSWVVVVPIWLILVLIGLLVIALLKGAHRVSRKTSSTDNSQL